MSSSNAGNSAYRRTVGSGQRLTKSSSSTSTQNGKQFNKSAHIRRKVPVGYNGSPHIRPKSTHSRAPIPKPHYLPHVWTRPTYMMPNRIRIWSAVSLQCPKYCRSKKFCPSWGGCGRIPRIPPGSATGELLCSARPIVPPGLCSVYFLLEWYVNKTVISWLIAFTAGTSATGCRHQSRSMADASELSSTCPVAAAAGKTPGKAEQTASRLPPVADHWAHQ